MQLPRVARERRRRRTTRRPAARRLPRHAAADASFDMPVRGGSRSRVAAAADRVSREVALPPPSRSAFSAAPKRRGVRPQVRGARPIAFDRDHRRPARAASEAENNPTPRRDRRLAPRARATAPARRAARAGTDSPGRTPPRGAGVVRTAVGRTALPRAAHVEHVALDRTRRLGTLNAHRLSSRTSRAASPSLRPPAARTTRSHPPPSEASPSPPAPSAHGASSSKCSARSVARRCSRPARSRSRRRGRRVVTPLAQFAHAVRRSPAAAAPSRPGRTARACLRGSNPSIRPAHVKAGPHAVAVFGRAGRPARARRASSSADARRARPQSPRALITSCRG